MSEGTIGDMAELGITESFQVKRQVLLSASEAAEMILRVDDVIKAAPRSVLSLAPLVRLRTGLFKLNLFLQEESSRPSPLLNPEEDASVGGAASVIYHPCRSFSTNVPSFFFCQPHCWKACAG